MREAPSPEPEKTCFIISPIGEKGTPKYINFKKVRTYLIDAVAEEKGYRTIRSDDVEEPGKITTQIIDHLRESDLVIADISDSNANVFYELAIRDAARKPVILIAVPGTKSPFDISDQRYLPYSIDVAEIEDAKKKLAGYIDSIESPGYVLSSPVTTALIKPEDNVPATTDELLKIMLKKINSLSTSTARSPAPRRRMRGLENTLRSLGVDVIDRGPESVRQFRDVSGRALDFHSFIQFVQVNILKGITLVNFDPVFEIYWLWEYGVESMWYFYDESLDRLSLGPTTYVTPSRER